MQNVHIISTTTWDVIFNEGMKIRFYLYVKYMYINIFFAWDQSLPPHVRTSRACVEKSIGLFVIGC